MEGVASQGDISRDGRFLISAMQEPMLHGWRLSDRKDMQMSGYAARVRSFAFTADDKLLATSGANQLILWPFHGKDGPMGRARKSLRPRNLRSMSSPVTLGRA